MSKKKILIGTQNAHKLKEIEEILSRFSIEHTSLSHFPELPDVKETGCTYEENAVIKATYFSNATGLPCVADDTGLEVDALGGEPGIYSARWAGVKGEARYKANNDKMIRLLKDVPPEKRTSRFICVVSLVMKDRVILTIRGVCEGKIIDSPRGNEGFGYDPLFLVPDYQKTFAELGDEIKNKISHRARAFSRFAEEISRLPADILD